MLSGLVLCSRITPGSVPGTICGAGNQSQIGHMQDKCPTRWLLIWGSCPLILNGATGFAPNCLVGFVAGHSDLEPPFGVSMFSFLFVLQVTLIVLRACSVVRRAGNRALILMDLARKQ